VKSDAVPSLRAKETRSFHKLPFRPEKACCTWRRVFTTSKGVVMKAAAVPEIELAIKATNGD